MSVALLAKSSTGVPLAGLTPTWTVYVDAVTGSSQGSPSFTDLGLGNYKFDPTGTNPAGIIDLGAAVPRYLMYAAFNTSVLVFAAYDEFGAPLASLTPTWNSLKLVSDGSNVSQPSISALGSGLYKTTFQTTPSTGAIDLGATASPRYIQYDSESLIALGYTLGYFAGQEDGMILEATQSIAKTVTVRFVSSVTGLQVTLSAPQLAATVFKLKKSGGAFGTITPTATLRDNFIDIDLTAGNLDTLGLSELYVDPLVAVPARLAIHVIAMNKADAVRAGLTALPNANAGANTGLPVVGSQIPNANASAAGGLPTFGTSTGQINLSGGKADAQVKGMDADTLTATALATTAVTEIQTGLSTSTAVTAIDTKLGTPAGASVSADVAAVQTKLGTPAGASVSADIAATTTSVGAVNTKLGTPAGASVSADIASVKSTADSVQTTAMSLLKIGTGRWKIVNNQLIIYDTNGSTPLYTFDLLDDTQTPSQTRVFERVPA